MTFQNEMVNNKFLKKNSKPCIFEDIIVNEHAVKVSAHSHSYTHNIHTIIPTYSVAKLLNTQYSVFIALRSLYSHIKH